MSGNKTRTLFGILLLFVINMSTLSSLWAEESAEGISPSTASVKLQITGGLVSGSIKNATIRDALEFFSSQHPFEYHGKELLFNQRISGQFDSVPLLAALRQVLKTFNYYLILSEESGNIESLTLKSIIVASDNRFEAPVDTSNAIGNVPTAPTVEFATGNDYHSSYITEDEITEQAQDLPDSFYPVQEPGSEETGPQAFNGEAVKELPTFNTIENDTGPVDPNITSAGDLLIFDSFPQ